MHESDQQNYDYLKTRPWIGRLPREREVKAVAIRCIDCSQFFSIRERPNQGFRYHRCAECATRILAAKIKRGEALPVRVSGAGA